jgi:hypothetical protein
MLDTAAAAGTVAATGSVAAGDGDDGAGGGDCRRQPPASVNAVAAMDAMHATLMSGGRRNITLPKLYWGSMK